MKHLARRKNIAIILGAIVISASALLFYERSGALEFQILMKALYAEVRKGEDAASLYENDALAVYQAGMRGCIRGESASRRDGYDEIVFPFVMTKLGERRDTIVNSTLFVTGRLSVMERLSMLFSSAKQEKLAKRVREMADRSIADQKPINDILLSYAACGYVTKPEPEPEESQTHIWIRDGRTAYYTIPETEWDFAIICDADQKRIRFTESNVDEPPAVPFRDIQVGNVRRRIPATFDPDGLGSITSEIPLDHPFIAALVHGKSPLRFHNDKGLIGEIPVTAVVRGLVRECGGRK
jgi:hypothetical protein